MEQIIKALESYSGKDSTLEALSLDVLCGSTLTDEQLTLAASLLGISDTPKALPKDMPMDTPNPVDAIEQAKQATPKTEDTPKRRKRNKKFYGPSCVGDIIELLPRFASPQTSFERWANEVIDVWANDSTKPDPTKDMYIETWHKESDLALHVSIRQNGQSYAALWIPKAIIKN